MKISIICGTNRVGNNSQYIALLYQQLFKEKSIETSYLSMEHLPFDFAFRNEVFGNSSLDLCKIVSDHIENTNKFLVVSPEYNGSTPGIIKAFIDGIQPSRFSGKKVALVGVSSGRYGNLRGMDHLSSVFNYLNCTVLPLKIGITMVDKILDDRKQLTDERTLHFVKQQIEQFISF